MAMIVALTPATLYEPAKVELARVVEACPEVAHERPAPWQDEAAGLTVGRPKSTTMCRCIV